LHDAGDPETKPAPPVALRENRNDSMAATNKWLARGNKLRTGANATKALDCQLAKELEPPLC
jgi:hypothetical protein